MRFPQNKLAIAGWLLLGAYSTAIGVSVYQTLFPQPQSLPISALATLSNGQTIQLEVADKPEQKAIGLQHRYHLENGRGILFTFPPSTDVNFWMKDTHIAVDILFIRNGRLVSIKNANPCIENPCPLYSENDIDQVIEVNQGEYHLQPGTTIDIRFTPGR